MTSFVKVLYDSISSDKDIMPKAIANFLFRELIEDAHAKYKISQDDVRDMCREAVNRSAVLLEAMKSEELKKAFVIHGYSTEEWDAPNQEKVAEMHKFLKAAAEAINC